MEVTIRLRSHMRLSLVRMVSGGPEATEDRCACTSVRQYVHRLGTTLNYKAWLRFPNMQNTPTMPRLIREYRLPSRQGTDRLAAL